MGTNDVSNFSFFVLQILNVLLSNIVAGYIQKAVDDHPRFASVASIKKLWITVILFLILQIPIFYLTFALMDNGSPTINENEDWGNYQVRIIQAGSQESVQSAKVTIEVGNGSAPLDEFTDSNGLARFQFDRNWSGLPGRIIVEAEGYKIHRQEIDIDAELVLPDTIQLEPLP